jgi:hypothetical protein
MEAIADERLLQYFTSYCEVLMDGMGMQIQQRGEGWKDPLRET